MIIPREHKLSEETAQQRNLFNKAYLDRQIKLFIGSHGRPVIVTMLQDLHATRVMRLPCSSRSLFWVQML